MENPPFYPCLLEGKLGNGNGFLGRWFVGIAIGANWVGG